MVRRPATKAPPLDEAKARAFLGSMEAGDSFYAALRLARMTEATLKAWLNRGRGPTRIEAGKPAAMPPEPYASFNREFARIVIARTTPRRK